MSRDPKLRQCIPASWKEVMHKWGGSGCQGQSPLGSVFFLGSLPESLGNQSHSVPLPAVFLAPLAKLQSQRTSLLVPLSLPLHPRTPSLLSLCLESCSLWEPGSALLPRHA